MMHIQLLDHEGQETLGLVRVGLLRPIDCSHCKASCSSQENLPQSLAKQVKLCRLSSICHQVLCADSSCKSMGTQWLH